MPMLKFTHDLYALERTTKAHVQYNTRAIVTLSEKGTGLYEELGLFVLTKMSLRVKFALHYFPQLLRWFLWQNILWMLRSVKQLLEDSWAM